jgi:AAA family ATP:ADP antiporter
MSGGVVRDPPATTAVTRLLNLFTEVRPGEAGTLLALTLNVFLILTAYYLIKPVREALILSEPGGAELKSYAAAGQALLLLVAVPAYGWLAGRVPRMRLIDSVTVFFALCLVGFYVLIHAGVPVAIVFFLWVGIFNLMVPAQFWAFANDVYDTDTGKRLFVLVAFGASSGAVCGSFLAEFVIHHVGVYQMLLLGAVLLVSTLALGHLVDRRERHRPHAAGDASAMAGEPLGKGSAFGLLWSNRYLLLIALMLLLNNWVNSSGEYVLGRIVSERASELAASGTMKADEYIAEFYAGYFEYVNLAGMLLQLLVVSRVIRYIGVPVAVCLLPLITLGSYTTIALLPVLGVVRWVKIGENAVDYSLQGTVKQILWLPTTRTEKYKAKQAIDTFFVRMGDVFAALMVLLGIHVLALETREFALMTGVLCVLWLGIAIAVGRRFGELVPPQAPR